MKTRDYKEFYKGGIYHVYNRGNNKDRIFIEESDFQNFLKRLKISLGMTNPGKLRIKPFQKGTFSILAYCLMDNHFHFIIKQNTNISISHLIGKVCSSYAWYLNKKYNRVGHVFQDVFKTKLIDTDEYLKYVSAYLHINPKDYFKWKFSSLHEYINKPDLCDVAQIFGLFNDNLNEYLQYLKILRDFTSKPPFERGPL